MSAVYRYSARSLSGEIVRGAMEAASADAVFGALRTRALFVTAIERETALAGSVLRLLRPGSSSRRALLTFFRSIATLVGAGISIRRSLEIAIERSPDKSLRESLRAVLNDIEDGASLAAAMQRRVRTFTPLAVAMIRAGETGGILDDVLERLASLIEREADVRKKVRAALAYPAVVLAGALGLVVFLLARIVPMFADMFAAFRVEVPPATRVLLALGAWLQYPLTWTTAAALGLAVLATFGLCARSPRGARVVDGARLRLPLIGPMLRKAIIARIARMLATLLASGIDLVTAIEVVRPVAGSVTYSTLLAEVARSIREGETLAAPLESSRLFDPLAVALVRVGEETGLVDDMLSTVAGYFESDVAAAITTLGAVLEPALIGTLGIVVGFIVFSVFIPLYTLIGSVSN